MLAPTRVTYTDPGPPSRLPPARRPWRGDNRASGVLAFHDGSPCASAVLDAALNAARGHGRRLMLLVALPPASPTQGEVVLDYEARALESAGRLLRSTEARAAAAGIACESLVRFATDPSRLVRGVAVERSAGLIVALAGWAAEIARAAAADVAPLPPILAVADAPAA